MKGTSPFPSNPLRKQRAGRSVRTYWQLYAMLAIPMCFLFLFKYGSYFGLLAAFEKYKILQGVFGSEWVGFENFVKVFAHRRFGDALRNTVLLNVLDLVFGFPMPILLALMLNEMRHRPAKRVSQTLLYLPHFLSWVIVGAIAYQLFSYGNGVVNDIIERMGAGRIPFLQEDTHWLTSYVAIGVWQSMGWGTIVYLAAITGINPELYEAAVVDGANRWKQCWNVTVPGIKPTMVTLFIMRLGQLMGGSFERVIALKNVATTEYTYTIPVMVYDMGLLSGTSKIAQATALGFFQSVIGVILVIGADYLAKSLGEEGLL
jgi:putative aldouronate transport system permease protein